MSNKLTPACKEKRKKIQNPLYFHPCRETNTDFVLESSSALTKQGSARTNVSLIKLCVRAHVIVGARTWQRSDKSESLPTSGGRPACPLLSRQSRSRRVGEFAGSAFGEGCGEEGAGSVLHPLVRLSPKVRDGGGPRLQQVL